jgi:C1A family cysteine protease
MSITINLKNVNGTIRNLSWKSRKEYFARNPTTLPNKFSEHSHKFSFVKTAEGTKATSYRVINEQNVPIYDQGDIGSCTCNALCAAVMITDAVEGNPIVTLSRLFLYYNARLVQGDINNDTGSDTATVVAMALQFGLPRETSFPYGDNNFLVNSKAIVPAVEVYTEASNNKSYNWVSIDGSGETRLAQIEAALRANYPVIWGTPVDSTIQTYQAGQVLTVPNSNDIIGGHEMCIVGVNYDSSGNRTWLVRNSWGTGWGGTSSTDPTINQGYFLADDAWIGWDQADGFDFLTKANKILF